MAGHQFISQIVDQAPVIYTSGTEMLAVLRCAASLARKEGMVHTAERLDHDANVIESLLGSHSRLTIVVQQ